MLYQCDTKVKATAYTTSVWSKFVDELVLAHRLPLVKESVTRFKLDFCGFKIKLTIRKSILKSEINYEIRNELVKLEINMWNQKSSTNHFILTSHKISASVRPLTTVFHNTTPDCSQTLTRLIPYIDFSLKLALTFDFIEKFLYRKQSPFIGVQGFKTILLL